MTGSTPINSSAAQLNGLTEGSYYGDDTNASTNFPLVKIVNNTTGNFYFARTFNHSSRSITPNKVGSTDFQVPYNTEIGNSTLYVIANGIPSGGTNMQRGLQRDRIA